MVGEDANLEDSGALCSEFELWPSSNACSNGKCQGSGGGGGGDDGGDTSFCVCEMGFLSVGDYKVRGSSCDIHKVSIQVLWGLLTVSSAFAFPYFSWFVYRKLRSGKTPRNDPLLVFAMNGVMCTFCIGISALLRTIDPESNAIGHGKAMTAFFALGTSFFWLAASFLLWAFLKLMVNNLKIKNEQKQKSIQNIFWRLKIILPIFVLSSTCWCMMPLFLFKWSGQYATQVIAGIHYVGSFMTILINGINMAVTVKSLTKDIESVTSDKSSNANHDLLEQTLQKLRRFRKEAISQSLQQAPVAIPFGIWPFLTTKASYQLPIAWTSGMWIAVVAFSLLDHRTKNSTVVSTTRSNTDNDGRMEKSTSNANGAQSFTVATPSYSGTHANNDASTADIETPKETG